MNRSAKRKVAAGAAAAVAIAGGGAAVAATQLSSPKEESQAVVNDAAGQLGVQPQALTDALKKALENRVDAAVADGRLTKEQGDALKQRIESGDAPLFFGPGLGHQGPLGHFRDLDAAAAYLGLTEAELQAQLEAGKTLAQVATAQGKSVDGLVDALVASAKKHLDDAVAAGRLTQAQEAQVLSDLKQRITDRVNGKATEFDGRRGFAGTPRQFGAFA
jgi:polyhydroxyalkanoate synthesis regulator phasin